jgi:hypothetical protein
MAINHHHRGYHDGRPDDPHGVTASQPLHPHQLQAAKLKGQNQPWHAGFVGTYQGNVGDQAFFSSEATKGGPTDALVANWAGTPEQVGRRMAVLPDHAPKLDHPFGSVSYGAKTWDLTDSPAAEHYSHLPGFQKPE